MNIWKQDNYIKAWNYASVAHNGQFLPASDIPYINHIGLVAMEAMAAILNSNSINSPDLLVLSALLHDTIEDTNSTYDEIKGILVFKWPMEFLRYPKTKSFHLASKGA